MRFCDNQKFNRTLLLAVFAFSFFAFGTVYAGAEHNVSGWAWSENVGWISFNSISGGGGTDYGVDVDVETGIFSGYAWSENVGWISFNESDLSGCPAIPCQASFDTETDTVSGWAKALGAGSGWDGWISLKGVGYGVSWDSGTQEMEGWAWSDGVMGWISFNCSNQGECGSSSYAVSAALGEAPVCDSLNAVPSQGVAPLSVSLSGAGHDNDGTIEQYGFIFGDGGSSTTTASTTNHIYSTPGTYCAKLRLKDNEGNWSALPGDCPGTCAKQINVSENNPPVSSVDCDGSGCGSGSSCNGTWIAYNRNCQFYFLNKATDPDSTNPPDNNDDIVKSTWSIFYQGGTPWQDPYLVCNDDVGTPENEGICDMLMPVLPASQNYYVTLTVQDNGGLTDDYSHSFYVRREVAADFQCSLDPEEGWQSCNGFGAAEDEIVYFKDISVPSEGSSGISSWSWSFEDGTPVSSTEQNPSASFKNIDGNSGTVLLIATDSAGRTDSQQYSLQITIPLPQWREVAPF